MNDIPLERLRRIGWELWDPIGITRFPGFEVGKGPVDEYDRYLLHAASMIEAGHTTEAVADYLIQVEVSWMSLGPCSDNGFQRATAVADALAVLVREHQDGAATRRLE